MITTEYRKISIPKDLVERAENLVKDKNLKTGYLNVTDFIRDAIRIHINHINAKRTYINYRNKKE